MRNKTTTSTGFLAFAILAIWLTLWLTAGSPNMLMAAATAIASPSPAAVLVTPTAVPGAATKIVPSPTRTISAGPTITSTLGLTETLLAALQKNDTITSYRGEISFAGDALGTSSWRGEVQVPNSRYITTDSNVRDAEVIQFNGRTFVLDKQAVGADRWFEVPESQIHLYPKSSPRATIRELVGILSLYTLLDEVELDGISCTVYGLDKPGAGAIVPMLIMGRPMPPDWQPTAEEMAGLAQNAEAFEQAEAKLWLCEDGYIHQASLFLHFKPQAGTGGAGSIADWQAHIYDINADIQIAAPTNVGPLPSPTPTRTKTPVPTPTPSPTPAPAQRTATVVAARTNANSITTLKPVLSDSFDKIANDWTTDSSTTESGKITKKIEDGKYSWTVRSSKPIVNRDLPKLDPFLDGAVSVDVRRLSGPADCAYGMTVGDDLRNYYYFVIRTDGVWRMARGIGQDHDAELAAGKTLAIKPDGANHLLVVRRAGNFDLFINDEFVSVVAPEESGGRGTAGLVLELGAADQECMVEFDNFEVRVPPPSSIGKPVVAGFDTANTAQFPTGEYSGDLVSGKREIKGKTYRWELAAQDSSIDQFALPNMEAVSDFTASVTVQSIGGPERAEAGLVLRHNDPDSQFLFGITNFGSYVFSLTRDGENDTLIFPTSSDAIKPGESNELMVVANGRQFDLYINGQMVERVTNSDLSKGTVGLYSTVYDGDSTAIFEFGAFQVGVPE